MDIEVEGRSGWGGLRLSGVGSSGSRREKKADEKERAVRFGEAGPGDGGGGKKGGGKAKVRAQRVSADDNASDADVGDEGGDEVEEERADGGDGTERWVPDRRVGGRLRQFGGGRPLQEGDMVEAEVVQHSVRTALPSLVVVTPPAKERFAAFVERYAVGDDVEVEVIGEALPGWLERGLQVRELATGFEVVVPVEELVLFSDSELLAPIQPGTRFDLALESVDEEGETVLLTGVRKLVPLLRKYQFKEGDEGKAGKGVHPATVARVDASDRAVFIHVYLDSSDLARGLVLPVRLMIFREFYEVGGELRIPYKVGDTVHVKIGAMRGARTRRRVSGVSGKVVGQLKSKGVSVEDGRLVTDGPMRLKSRDALLAMGFSEELREAVREVFVLSHRLQGERVTTDLEQRFRPGTKLTGKVRRVGGEGVFLILDGAVNGHVAIDELCWWSHGGKKKPWAGDYAVVGNSMKVVVWKVDPGTQTVHVSRRRLKGDPWKGAIRNMYPEGKRVDGIVRNVVGHIGAWVKVEPGLDAFVPNAKMRSFNGGDWVDDATDLVGVGDRVRMTIDSIDMKQRKLSAQLEKMLERGAVVDARSQEVVEEDEKPEFVPWTDAQWPWTGGENAIKPGKKPKKAQLPKQEKVAAVESRPDPTNWVMSWW